MVARSLLMLLVFFAALTSCADEPAVLPPDRTSADGIWLMVMNDCDADCEEPGIGMGSRFYSALACEPIDEAHLGERIAVPDPESTIAVPYEAARPIAGVDTAQAVAVGVESPSVCDDRDLVGWFAFRSQEHLYSDNLAQQLRSLAP